MLKPLNSTMPLKNEICKYFQRGSCRYGNRCQFIHPKPQQTQTNPFGFGNQIGAQIQDTRQPVSNPFGFGSKSNQPKPFENKWSRFSPINNASTSRQPDNKPQAANHKCTDPQSCKQYIQADLKNEEEKPLWKLTCYGHIQNGPCDITGDISYDELRALAYDDYKNGKSIEAIVERERNLLASKLIEFQNLREPDTVSSAPIPSSQNFLAGSNTNPPNINNGFSTQVSSFSQLSGSLKTRSAAVPNYSFGQANAFQNHSQPSSLFQTNNSPFNSSGSWGTSDSQPQQFIQSAFPFGTTKPTSGGESPQQNPFSTLGNSLLTGSGVNKQFNFFSNEPSLASNSVAHSTSSIQSIDIPKENTNVDGGVWTKPEWKWNAGEIPEEAPPDIYIR